jgi:hypothetical protein
METVDFIYNKREYYYKDIHIFTATSVSDLKCGNLEYNKIFIKLCRKLRSIDDKDLRDVDLLNGMVIKELSNPNTFPRFSNENPFKIYWNKSFIYNPRIIGIKWSGYGWEYRIKNIGHEYDYQSEDRLVQL